MITTSTNNATPKPMTFAQIDELLRQPKPPQIYGFFVSNEIWDALRLKFTPQSGATLQEDGSVRGFTGTNGVPLAVDPDLAPTVVDVAFTEKAWRDRLSKLKAK